MESYVSTNNNDIMYNKIMLSNKRKLKKWSMLMALFVWSQELEKKRKERAQLAYERKKQLVKLRSKAEKIADEKLGSQLEILASVKY